MIERTVEIEKHMGGAPTLLDLVKGTDLRRTTIICLMYASQNFAGNLIANQATFFFERKLRTLPSPPFPFASEDKHIALPSQKYPKPE